MSESTRVKDHCDTFNRSIQELQGFYLKNKDVDLALILLCY